MQKHRLNQSNQTLPKPSHTISSFPNLSLNMPPRAAKRPPTTTPLKKKPIPKEEEEYKDNQPDTTISLNNNNNREEDYEEVEEPHHASSSPAPKEEGEGREEGFVNEIDKSEKLDLEDNYEQFEAEKHVEDDNDGEPEEEEVVEYDEGSMDGDDAMMEGEAEEDAGGDEEIDGHDEEGDQEAEEHHDVVKERRKRKEFEVFVGGLDRDATEEDLKEVFSQVGEITQVRLLMNPLTNKNKGFAFLRFATVEQAKRALNELKHPVVNGKQCGVSPSQDSDTLFVGNICKTWTKAALKEKLAHYGVDNFEELTLVEDTGNDGHNRGFAFLDFCSRADALVACRRLQKLDVVFGTDRTAKVAFADSFIEPDDEIMAQVKTVFLDGLPSSWDEERVAEHLKMFGKVEKVELSRNMPAAKRTDFGFVTFDTHDAAVACVEGVNSTEFVDGDKKVKVRARLSRPRQRGKSSRHARGGYLVGRGSSRGGMLSRYSSVPRTDYWRSGGRGGRGIPSRGPYIGRFKRPLDPRDRYRGTVVAPSRVERRQVPSLQRPISRRSPGIANGRSSSRREYARHGEHYPSSAGFASRTPEERSLSYRDAYTSRRSGYPESPPRSAQRSAPRRPYIEESYERRVERPSSYTDSHSRSYGSLSGSKRPYSSMEEYQSRYTEPTVRESRARIDYRGSAVHSLYNENAYGSESTRSGRGSHQYDRVSSSSASRSHGLYDTRTSSMGYSRDEVSRGNDGEMYSRYERAYTSKDYTTTGANVGTTSYSPLYSSRRTGDAYISGRGSGSYY